MNAIVLGATNASLEAVNSNISAALKKRACGYRSRARFRSAILFFTAGGSSSIRPSRPLEFLKRQRTQPKPAGWPTSDLETPRAA
nr:transposase [Plesiocystis pacifica]